jgi:hypothetical protein
MDIQNSSRRSFMKKTTALAVGISATTLFSGLVHAADLLSSGTKVVKCGPGGFPADGDVETCENGQTCKYSGNNGGSGNHKNGWLVQ